MKNLFTFLILIFINLSLSADQENKSAKPNIIFFLIDDLAWSDIACSGSEFHETKNIDQLAIDGIRFTNAYAASPVCSPTRASILTGKYPTRVNFTRATPTESLALDEVTIAEALKEANYRTAHMGKWHLQIYKEKNKNHYPEAQGFDVNVAGHAAGQPGSFFFPYKSKRSPNKNVPGLEDGKEGDYLTDILTDKAIEFIDETKDQPFFLNMCYYSVHTPVTGKEDKIAKYEKKAKTMGFTKSPSAIQEYNSWHRKKQDNPEYAAMVESMDENIGRILNHLKKIGKDENTIIIFSSDNGGLSTNKSDGKGGPTSCLPLRAGKAWVYEGGIRVPTIIKWPKVIKAGSTSDEPIVSTDYYPTILEMIGLSLKPKQHLDGISLVPILKGEKKELERDAIHFHFPHDHGVNSMGASSAIRVGDFKLVERFSDMSLELYNLKSDLGEQNNLASKMPELTEKLKQMMETWRKDTGAWIPSTKDSKIKKNSKK